MNDRALAVVVRNEFSRGGYLDWWRTIAVQNFCRLMGRGTLTLIDRAPPIRDAEPSRHSRNYSIGHFSNASFIDHISIFVGSPP